MSMKIFLVVATQQLQRENRDSMIHQDRVESLISELSFPQSWIAPALTIWNDLDPSLDMSLGKVSSQSSDPEQPE